MATITKLVPTIAGITAAFSATTPAGDVIPYGGGDLVIEIDNGHSSPVTVNIVPTNTSVRAPGAGSVTTPTRSNAVTNGETAIFVFRKDEISAYLNSSRQVPVTYTSGNAACLIRAFEI